MMTRTMHQHSFCVCDNDCFMVFNNLETFMCFCPCSVVKFTGLASINHTDIESGALVSSKYILHFYVMRILLLSTDS